MYFFLFLLMTADTLVHQLAWPYYIAQSYGYKAVRFSPQLPCSITQFLCGVGSPVPNVTKECTLIVWCDGGNRPGGRLLTKVINIRAIDMNKIYWYSYDFSPPLHMVEPFWIGIWESNTFPTTVFDELPSFSACYSTDGTTWGSAGSDYFYAVAVKYFQSQLHIIPESLNFHIYADTNQCDTAILTVINRAGLCNLSVDSIIAEASWVLAIKPKSFGLQPMDSGEVEVVCGNVSSDGVYHGTLYIFSDDPYNNPRPVPLTLTVTGYGIAELRIVGRELRVSPNPFINSTILKLEDYKIKDRRIIVYDMSGRLVEEKSVTPQNNILKIGEGLRAGIYFVNLIGYKPVKIIKVGGVK